MVQDALDPKVLYHCDVNSLLQVILGNSQSYTCRIHSTDSGYFALVDLRDEISNAV